MSGTQPSPWSEILAMSTAMLRHAEAGEWSELAELESQRRGLIDTDMQAPPVGADCAEYARALQTLLSLDKRTMALARIGQAELAKQLQGITAGRNAVQAYSQVG